MIQFASNYCLNETQFFCFSEERSVEESMATNLLLIENMMVRDYGYPVSSETCHSEERSDEESLSP